VAKEIDLADPFENLGAQMVREGGEQDLRRRRDGTTTATVLAQAIFREGAKLVAAGMNAMDLKRGIDKAVAVLVESLAKQTKKTRSSEEIAQVGTISANGDETIGQLPRRGDGEGRQGRRDHRGRGQGDRDHARRGRRHADRSRLPLAYFVTNTQAMEVVLEDALVLLHEKKISSMKDLLPLLEQVAQSAQPLLIVSGRPRGDALATVVVNKIRGLAPVRGREGAGVRRPPQGAARRHGDPDRRAPDRRGARPQARERDAEDSAG